MINATNVFSPSLKSEILKDDLEKLSESFKLLRETTDQVSVEASAAASYLQEQLHDTTFRFFSVIDSINDLVLVKDAKNRWRTLNKFGQKLYKLEIIDYFKKTDLEIAEKFPEHAKGLKYCAITDELAWNSKHFHREIECFEIEKELRYFDIIKTPVFFDNGERKELIIIGRDITELKNSELRNKTCINALNAASDNFLIFDSDGYIIFGNDNFIKEFEFEDHNKIEGKSIEIFSSEVFNDEIFNKIYSNNSWSGNLKLKTFNQKNLEGSVSILPVMNGCSHPSYYICLIKTKNTSTLLN